MKILNFISILAMASSLVACTGDTHESADNDQKTSALMEESIDPQDQGDIVLMIHGGASYPTATRNNPKRDSIIRHVMNSALIAGRDIIKNGGSSLDAVQVAIRMLEDSPYFNAGRGAVFNSEGINELDACIMEGSSLKAGAVAGVKTIKNPIDAARAVMDSSDNVLLAGSGAEIFLSQKGIELVPSDYFYSQDSWDELIEAKTQNSEPIPEKPTSRNEKFGTVGAVALDIKGDISAGTSTGGRNNKRFGRIGDSPIIGASTYADNRYCGVSSTGWGELFIRNCTAHSVIAHMEYKNSSVTEAAQSTMYEKMEGIEGGIIALDKEGNGSFPFNTPVMNRGYITLNGEPRSFIYK